MFGIVGGGFGGFGWDYQVAYRPIGCGFEGSRPALEGRHVMPFIFRSIPQLFIFLISIGMQEISREQARQLVQRGFENQPQAGRLSFQEHSRVAHPRVLKRIFDSPPRKDVIVPPPPLFTARQASKIVQGRQFSMPALPQGRELRLRILSNYGDGQHVGLNGLEIFDFKGGNITRYVQIPEQEDFEGKKRLIDGYQAVQDRRHLWLSSKIKSEILIDLTFNIRISMIRIWNYNESRIATYKGVKKLAIYLDGRIIFVGEIRKASGDLKKFQENCEYLLFTEEEAVIKRIADNDWLNQRAIDFSIKFLDKTLTERPKTGSKSQQSSGQKQQYSNRQEIYPEQREQLSIQTKDLVLEFMSSTKRPIGLSRILLYDNLGKVLLAEEIIESSLNDFDFRRLLSLENLHTTEPRFMTQLQSRRIEFRFRSSQRLSGIRIYNYNEPLSEAFLAGPEAVRVSCNGREKIHYLRFGTFSEGCDSSQLIQLSAGQGPEKLLNLIGTPHSYPHLIAPPIGMLVTVHLVSTHGDQHYVGLNGLEIYDSEGVPMLHRNKVPYKIVAVPDLKGDPRVAKNLASPPYGMSCPPQQSFLAPFINTPQEGIEKLKNQKNLQLIRARDLDRQDVNKLHVLFERYAQFTAIDFYNYTKDQKRGVKEVHVFINHKLIYQGMIQQAINDAQLGVGNRTTIMFTDDQALSQKLQPKLNEWLIQPVTMIDEGEYLTRQKQQVSNWNNYGINLVRPQTTALYFNNK